ncbi:MAG: hypothetical protein ACK40C_06615 [Novosphingobium meiothermophilum]
MAFARFLCLFDRHRPVREGVEWNGVAFVGTCKHCGAAIRRREGGGWRRFTREDPPIFGNQ